MITLHASAKVKAGKGADAAQYAKDVAEHLKTKPPQALAIRIYSEVFRDVGTIHFFADHESLAAFDSQRQQYSSDEEWLAYVRAADDIFIEGSWRYSVLESI